MKGGCLQRCNRSERKWVSVKPNLCKGTRHETNYFKVKATQT